MGYTKNRDMFYVKSESFSDGIYRVNTHNTLCDSLHVEFIVNCIRYSR